MRLKVLTVIFLVVFLVGCATARKGQDIQVQQLQNRISYLEEEMQRKDEEINSLEKGRRMSLGKQRGNDIVDISTEQIQMALKNAGFYKGPIDGKMGSKTKEAIKAFQKDNDLKVDGVVGKQTLSELKRYLTR